MRIVRRELGNSWGELGNDWTEGRKEELYMCTE